MRRQSEINEIKKALIISHKTLSLAAFRFVKWKLQTTLRSVKDYY